MSAVSISYCTTCKGRLHQLRETLAGNLATLQSDEEIVLVDFNSPDGVAAWVWDNFRSDIERGALRFFEVLDEAPWHMAKAKNVAHRLSRGDYLFNLDADNFILPLDTQRIRAARQEQRGCRQGTGNLRDGTPGRIGIARAMFDAIGGYDEGLLRTLIDDYDLIIRAEAAGYRFVRLGAPERLPLQHAAIERLGATASPAPPGQDDHDRIGQINRVLSHTRLKIEGPRRLQNFATYRGRLNGEIVIFDGLGNFHPVPA
jgi:hypothetical protein